MRENSVSVSVSDVDVKEFSRQGDLAFSRFTAGLHCQRPRRLLAELALDEDRLGQLRHAAATFVAASLRLKRVPADERALFQAIADGRSRLSNLTPNGMLTPKREHTLEFNALHNALVDAWELGDAFPLVERVHLPLNLRVNFGEASPARDARPYATNKHHSDVWAGEPLDAIVVHVPLFGDLDALGIEFGEMPKEHEAALMRTFDSYDEPLRACGGIALYDDFRLRHGYAVFADARLLHRTIRRGPGMRVSIDFRFRVKSDGAFSERADRLMSPNRRDNYLTLEEWRDVGRRRLMVFPETMEQAAQRFGKAVSTTATTRHPSVHRLVELFAP